MSLELDLIEIALRDIKSSSILYEEKLYAQSYFYFQQASEKANKALGLFAGIITEDESKNDIKHKQLRIHRKAIVREELKINKLKEYLDKNPQIANHEFIKRKPFEQHTKNLRGGIKFHDSANNRDLLNYDEEELEYCLDYIEELKNIKVRPTKKFDEAVFNELNSLRDFANKFYGENARKDLEEVLKSENKEELLKIIYQFTEYQIKSLFINFTFYFCALITLRHSSISRYPENNINPLNFYNTKNLSVKYQPFFMDYLRKALIQLRKFVVLSEEKQKHIISSTTP